MVMVTLELFLSLCETVLSFIFTIFYSGIFTFIVYIMKMVKLHKKLSTFDLYDCCFRVLNTQICFIVLSVSG